MRQSSIKTKHKIQYHQKFTKRDLLLEAHSVRFRNGLIYINLGTGDFCEQHNPANVKPLDLIYRNASTVMNLKHRLIAGRPKLKKYPPEKIELRRVILC